MIPLNELPARFSPGIQAMLEVLFAGLASINVVDDDLQVGPFVDGAVVHWPQRQWYCYAIFIEEDDDEAGDERELSGQFVVCKLRGTHPDIDCDSEVCATVPECIRYLVPAAGSSSEGERL